MAHSTVVVPKCKMAALVYLRKNSVTRSFCASQLPGCSANDSVTAQLRSAGCIEASSTQLTEKLRTLAPQKIFIVSHS